MTQRFRRKLGLFLLLSALLLVGIAACGGGGAPAEAPTPAPQEAAGAEPTPTPIVSAPVEVPEGGQLVPLVVRCKAATPEVGRCNNLVKAAEAANAELAARGDLRRIQVKAIQDNPDWGDYKTEFELASQAGKAPDIITSGHEHIGDWAPAGYILDLTDMLDQHPEFEDVIDSLWDSVTLDGRIYGVPQDAEARPFYFNKALLKKLGWSDAEIESLPDRVKAGEFTWEDMFDVAEEAVKKGVVAKGNGWWHRPKNGPDFLYYYYAAGGEIRGEGGKLIFDREAALKVYRLLADAVNRGILSKTRLDGDWTGWHTGVTSGEVLFWFGGSWNWAEWKTNYLADKGGEDWLWENVGFAPIPAMAQGTGKPTTLTHPLAYMISSQSKHPDLALLLIAKATTKELNTEYAVASGHLGILKSQATYEPYTQDKFLSQVLPLLEYTTFVPNSPYWSTWSEAYYKGIQAVEAGDLSPEEAVDFVVEMLQNELGENVIVR